MHNAEKESTDEPESMKEGVLWTEEDARRLLRQVDESGEQIAPFARRVGFKAQRLHWWISKLGWKRSRPLRSAGPAIRPKRPGVPAKPAGAQARPSGPKFVPVRVVPDKTCTTAAVSRGAGVVLEVGGRSIRVEADFDAQVLRRVVDLLEGQPC